MYGEIQNHWRGRWSELLGHGGDPVRIPAGEGLFRAGETPIVAVVTAGIVRVFTHIAGGRQLTVRYARQGDMVGLGAVVTQATTWAAEAATDTTVEVFAIERIRAAANRDAELSWRIIEHIAALASESVRIVAEAGSQPMAVRVAQHIRAIGVPAPDGSIVARVSHQRLAEAVGTAREVITREVRRLRTQGIIAAEPGVLTILDTERLANIAAGGEALRVNM
jgi:CRP/FNR family transcriptional regulator